MKTKFDPSVHTMAEIEKQKQLIGTMKLCQKWGISRPTLNRWMDPVWRIKQPHIGIFQERSEILSEEPVIKQVKKAREQYLPKKKKQKQIRDLNSFFQWIKNHPEHIHHDYFMGRFKNPRKPDNATIMKMLEVMNEANQ